MRLKPVRRRTERVDVKLGTRSGPGAQSRGGPPALVTAARNYKGAWVLTKWASGASQGGNSHTAVKDSPSAGRFSSSTPFRLALSSGPTRTLARLVVQLKWVVQAFVLMLGWRPWESGKRTAPTPSHGRTPLVPRAPAGTAEEQARRSRAAAVETSNLAPSSSAR